LVLSRWSLIHYENGKQKGKGIKMSKEIQRFRVQERKENGIALDQIKIPKILSKP